MIECRYCGGDIEFEEGAILDIEIDGMTICVHSECWQQSGEDDGVVVQIGQMQAFDYYLDNLED